MSAPERDHTRSGTDFLEYCLGQLQAVGPVLPRRMFGGYRLNHDGIFFGIVYKDGLYLKTDATSRARYSARGSVPFQPNAGQTLWSYYEVSADIIESADMLCRWADEAVAIQRARPGAARRS